MAANNAFVDIENDALDDEPEDDIGDLKDDEGNPRFLGMSMRTSTALSALSNRSKGSFIGKPIQLVKRFTISSQVADGHDSPHISDGRKLILLVGANQPGTKSFKKACDWYVTFLDGKCKTLWYLIKPAMVGVEEGNSAPNEEDLTRVDLVFTAIAEMLSKKKQVAFANFADELTNGSLMQDPDDRESLYQLLFILTGWLTMLYVPKAVQKPKRLQLDKKVYDSMGNKVDIHSRTIYTYNQNLEYIDHSLSLLLGQFGKLIPELYPQRAPSFPPASEYLATAFVCYHTLRKVCNINIEWVDAVNLHLEFDSSREVLKLFRFPSFCLLMTCHGYKSTPGMLSQLFNDNERDITGETPAEMDHTGSYFREILLTYRLIFGQDKKSYSLFAAEMHLHRNSSKPSILALLEADWMLDLLCGHGLETPDAAKLYESLHADNPQAYYMPTSFPWFAARLVAVQNYVKEQHPHSLMTMWHDHRDKSNWWQFWAVLFIGGSTIILSIFSLAFQIWQAVLTRQQLQQGPNPQGDI